jgi:plasmid stabilization system protein ParE
MRILWSPQSLRDLDAIREYIAKDSEHYAGLTIARIFFAVEQLIRFSRSGNSGDRRNVPPFLFRRLLDNPFRQVTIESGNKNL